MTFLWPGMLVGLCLVPIIFGVYVIINRRRQKRLSTFGFSTPGTKLSPGIRRHIPSALFLLSLLIILLALARPQAQVSLPRIEGTVIMVMDVSASMGATDVDPSRLEAAKASAREFIQSQPETVEIGLVSFSSSGFTIESPSRDTTALLAAIDRLEPTAGTSLGQGILSALNTIAMDAGLLNADQIPTPAAPGSPQQLDPGASELLSQLPEGIYPSSVIVLFSDGENNFSVNPIEIAAAAADHGVRVDALGFGTTAGSTLEVGGFSVHTALDEAMLQQITTAAGGKYYPAQGQPDPQAVYANLSPELVVKTELMEVTSLFAGASILMLLVGSTFSMAWFNRLL
ncbi:VWA domain-containing protein [bacterium]|nr:VWA domain-containing protein [bacterium]